MKVLFQSRQTLFSAPGGDTTQILKTKEYLEKLGVQIAVTTDLEPDLSEYDVVHVFNLMRPQDIYLQVRNAKKWNKKIALSTIYGPYEEYEKKARGGFLQFINKFLSITQIEYLKVIARAVLNWEFSKGTLIYLIRGHKSLQRDIVKDVDIFLPNSESEMLRVAKDFNLKKYKHVAVANAVDVNKFNYSKVEVEKEYEKYRDCVLCVARIEGRKNQLNVVRACKDLPYKFVFIGKPSPNSKKYYDMCVNEAPDNFYFLGPIEHEKLPQFYKLAKVHILASWMETPGLSSLEAGVLRTNVVVTKKGDTEDYFQNYAFYCEPDDLESIKTAVESAFNAQFDEGLRQRILDKYKWENTAEQTLQGYNMIL